LRLDVGYYDPHMYLLYVIVSLTVLGALGIGALMLFAAAYNGLHMLSANLTPARRAAQAAARIERDKDGLGYYRYLK
jgi:hypothetical protein